MAQTMHPHMNKQERKRKDSTSVLLEWPPPRTQTTTNLARM
jgi:hypothetical protein